MYKQIIDPMTGQVSTFNILRVSDHTYIPFDERNSDYQRYLEWVAEGNTPLPADQPTN